jgi:hypothetical protein
MNTASMARGARLSWYLTLTVFAGGLAAAQPPTTAERDALEPAAQSAAQPATAAATTAPAAPAAPAADPKKIHRATGSHATAAPQHAAPVSDRVDLAAETVTGNQELPKVMYIVPWKKSEIGDLAGRPMNSLLDEVLAPIDRDVFRREVTYYDAVHSEASQAGAAAGESGKPQ